MDNPHVMIGICAPAGSAVLPGQLIVYRLKRLTITAAITPVGTADKTLTLNCSIGSTYLS
jgi:uncharacterized membrane protein YgdD (TMEM256/DUF423 family)